MPEDPVRCFLDTLAVACYLARQEKAAGGEALLVGCRFPDYLAYSSGPPEGSQEARRVLASLALLG